MQREHALSCPGGSAPTPCKSPAPHVAHSAPAVAERTRSPCALRGRSTPAAMPSHSAARSWHGSKEMGLRRCTRMKRISADRCRSVGGDPSGDIRFRQRQRPHGPPKTEPRRTTHQPRSALYPLHPRPSAFQFFLRTPMRRETKERTGDNAIAFGGKVVARFEGNGLTPMHADEGDQRGSMSIGRRRIVRQYSVQGGTKAARPAEGRTWANDPSTAIRAYPLHPRPSAFQFFLRSPMPLLDVDAYPEPCVRPPVALVRYRRAVWDRKSMNNSPCAVRTDTPGPRAPRIDAQTPTAQSAGKTPYTLRTRPYRSTRPTDVRFHTAAHRKPGQTPHADARDRRAPISGWKNPLQPENRSAIQPPAIVTRPSVSD